MDILTYRSLTIISGGQSGADRAGLDAAIALGLPYGGFVPAKRRAEDGRISDKYIGLEETQESSYEERTRRNALRADLTFVFTYGPLDGGSKYTKDFCIRAGKTCIHFNMKKLNDEELIQFIKDDLRFRQPETINIAGNRESKAPGIHKRLERVLIEALKEPT